VVICQEDGMTKASDIMETNVISVTRDTDISTAVKILLDHHINGLPVLNEQEEIVGILCQSDLIFQQKEILLPPIFTLLDSFIPLTSSQKMEDEFKKIAATTVEQAMAKDPATVTADTPVSEIASLMVEKHFHTIPVVEGKKVIGIIGKEDILKTMTNPD
jgi:CBS domain-containing protein